MDIEQLKYPIGKFKRPEIFVKEETQKSIEVIEQFPSKIEKELSGLSEQDLNLTYRDGGWTIR